MPRDRSFSVRPPVAWAILALLGVGAGRFSRRARRAATMESTSGSVLPSATACSSLSSGTDFFWSIGRRVGLVALAHADAVDDDEVVLGLGVGRDGLQVVRR